jgi:hypothetical protein
LERRQPYHFDRANTTRKFREGAINRLNDQARSAIVIIMQRLHEQDVAGTVLGLNMGYEHLMLPMEFEIERCCSTSIGFTDPRTTDGDLLDPVRFPREVVDALLKRDTTSYAFASQYQQRPAPREGLMFKRAWFVDAIVDQPPPNCRWVRHWDLAASKKSTSARTAGVKIGRAPDGKFFVGNVVRIQEEGATVRQIILAAAKARISTRTAAAA